MDTHGIQMKAAQVFKKLGVTEEDLRTKVHVRFATHNRTTAIATTKFSVRRDVNDQPVYEVQFLFSTLLWPKDANQENTIVHEVCHAVNDLRWKEQGKPGFPQGHGMEWRAIMIEAGVTNPQRCGLLK